MFDYSQVTNALGTNAGWRQNLNPVGEQLTATVTTSDTGLYYNDEHPLLTFDNIKSIAPIFETIYPTWDATTQYADQQIIYRDTNQRFYQANSTPTIGNDPISDAAWNEYSPLSVWLQEKTDSSISRALNAWLDAKFEVKTARNLLGNDQLYKTTGAIESTSQLKSWFSGIQIVPQRSIGTLARVTSIGLQFTETIASLDVHLYDATQPATPVQTQNVNYTNAGGVQWFAVDWEVTGEGAYYIMYDQNDLGTALPVNGSFDYTHLSSRQTGPRRQKYFSTVPFELNPAELQGSILKFSQASYVPSDNFGLNLKVDIRCDYTSFIIDQKDLFKTIQTKQVAIDFLNELINNPNARVNRNEVIADKATILYEIEGDPRGRPGGLREQLDSAINNIMIDLNGIDKTCLPCRKRSIRFKAS